MCQLKTDASAVILSLIKTLHHTSEAHSGPDNEPFSEAKTGIMNTKIQESVEGHPNILRKDVLRFLSFSDAERGYIEIVRDTHRDLPKIGMESSSENL